MKRSEHRILTTHAGRLDGPPELVKLSRDVMAGHVADASALRPAVQRGIVDVNRRQAGAGEPHVLREAVERSHHATVETW